MRSYAFASSSTTSTRSPSIHAGCGSARETTAARERTGRRNEKVLPRPRELSTRTLPPCSSTKRLTSASPRPAPPNSRRAVPSTWRNSSKITAWYCGSMPTPSSLTETCRPLS
jgi:hypothetical protein